MYIFDKMLKYNGRLRIVAMSMRHGLSIFFAFVCVVCGSYGCQSTSNSVTSTDHKLEYSLAQAFSKDGTFSYDDYVRLYAIRQGILKSKQISGGDFDFAVSLLRKPSTHRATVVMEVLDDIRSVSILTHSQQDELYQEVMTTAAQPDITKNIVALASIINTLGKLGRKESTAYINNYINNSNSMVRDCSKRAIEKINSRDGVWN